MIRRHRGFTLIELMIVIAIIAIIAGISIPGLLRSQRASNERSASSSIKTIAAAEADFRNNDRDGNRVTDYWTRDVSGLYTIYPTGNPGNPIRLLELGVAAADAFAHPPITAQGYSTSSIATTAPSSPKASYWYYALVMDRSQSTPVSYAANTDGEGLYHNTTVFGFGAFPHSLNAGQALFIVNEANAVYRRTVITTIAPSTTSPPGGYPLATGVRNGATDDPRDWPTEANLQSNYGKLD